MKIYNLSLAVIPFALLTACSVKAPDCSSSKVKSAVSDQVFEASRSGVMHTILLNPSAHEVDTRKIAKEIPEFMVVMFGGQVSYAAVENNKNNAEVKKLILAIDKVMSEIEIDIEGIRTNKTDLDSKTVSCTAEVSIIVPGENTNKTVTINYEAQSSDDGDLYVKVM